MGKESADETMIRAVVGGGGGGEGVGYLVRS